MSSATARRPRAEPASTRCIPASPCSDRRTTHIIKSWPRKNDCAIDCAMTSLRSRTRRRKGTAARGFPEPRRARRAARDQSDERASGERRRRRRPRGTTDRSSRLLVPRAGESGARPHRGPQRPSVQYVAVRYTQRLAEAEAVASVRSTGDSYDNALAEAFNSLFQAELVRNQGPWKSIDDLEIAVSEYIDWFNHRRLHGEDRHRPTRRARDDHDRHKPAPATVEASVGSLHQTRHATEGKAARFERSRGCLPRSGQGKPLATAAMARAGPPSTVSR